MNFLLFLSTEVIDNLQPSLHVLSIAQDTLLPYAIENAEEYLKANWETDEVKRAVKLLFSDDENSDVSKTVEALKAAKDSEGVKILHGLIYRKGYEDGSLKAQ